MANQELKVIIAAPTFQSAIQIAMHEHFKKWFKPEEMSLRSVTDEPEIQKERLERVLGQTHPSALIAMEIRPDSQTIDMYKAANVPIVLFDEEMVGVSSISTDNVVGGRIAGEYLVKKGRKKIAIVSCRTQVAGGYNAEQRLKGFLQALKAAKISIPPEYMIEVPQYSREDGLEVMPKLLDKGIDAVFCAAGDNCALGLLTVAKDRGVRIPEELALIGFDDLLIARISSPPMTTIKQPLDKIAEAVYKLVTIHGAEILQKPRKMIFNPELVVRNTA
jgi:DNA-binding LacI/PurR family transcriptional regulator